MLVVTAGTVVASPAVPLGNTQDTTQASTVSGDDVTAESVDVTPHEPDNDSNESFRVSNLSVTDAADGTDGMNVTANITNPNDDPLIQRVELRVDGVLVDHRRWALNPGETEPITFTLDGEDIDEDAQFVSVLTRANGSVTQLDVSDGGPGGGGEEPAASISVGDQTSDGTGLTVTSVENIDTPSYVAVWTADENGLPDTVLGFQQVTETQAANLDVTFTENVTETQQVIVAVHPDTDGDAGTTDDPDTDTIVTSTTVTLTVEGEGEGEEPAAASVTFEDQTSNGSTVTVAEASRDMAPFFVAIWTVNESGEGEDPQPDTLLGAAEVVSTTDENVTVDLTEADVNESGTLIAAIHPPSGEVGIEGEPDTDTVLASDTAEVTIEAGGPGEEPTDNDTDGDTGNETDNASVTLADQDSDGTTLTIESVTLPEGGFVAIHDETLLEGNVVGSVVGVSEHLDPGTHENVTVTLFDVPGAEFDETELTESQALIAMPHLDTNGNQTYDFVTTDGEADGPYVTDAGDPVVADATVTVESNNDTNESAVVLP